MLWYVAPCVLAVSHACSASIYRVEITSFPVVFGLDATFSRQFDLIFIYIKIYIKRFIAQEISDILVYKKLQNCSLNQFALVVARCASDRVSALLGCY
jgi:hypothetical protein